MHCVSVSLRLHPQELMAVVPLVEVQATRTQRPTAGTSYPYVDITVGDMSSQRVVQLQLEQVLHHLFQDALFFLFSFFSHSAAAHSSTVRLSPGPGIVSSHRHASGKHDARAGQASHPATERDHHVIGQMRKGKTETIRDACVVCLFRAP